MMAIAEIITGLLWETLWLWSILFGVIFFFGGLYRSLKLYLLKDWASWTFIKFLILATIGSLVTTGGVIYLELTPLETLQLTKPPPAPTPQIGENGLPVASQLRIDPLPGIVEMFNTMMLPLFKSYWPGALLLYAVWVFRELLSPRPRRRRSSSGGDLWQLLNYRKLRTLDDLYRMNPIHFEHLCARFFNQQGYQATSTRASKDGGIDLTLKKNNRLVAVVQCKRYAPNNSIGVKPVRELFGVLHSEQADYAYFVTTSYFTKDAEDFARKNPTMRLIDGKQFMGLGQKLGIFS